MRTYKDLEKWIEINAKDLGKGTTNDKCLWFIATELAYDHSDYTTKDIAWLILKGQSALTNNDIDEWLKTRISERFDESLEKLDNELIKALQIHFGIKNV